MALMMSPFVIRISVLANALVSVTVLNAAGSYNRVGRLSSDMV